MYINMYMYICVYTCVYGNWVDWKRPECAPAILFYFWYDAATQLTRQLHQERTQSVCGHGVIRQPRNARPNRTALPQWMLDTEPIMLVGMMVRVCSRHLSFPFLQVWMPTKHSVFFFSFLVFFGVDKSAIAILFIKE